MIIPQERAIAHSHEPPVAARASEPSFASISIPEMIFPFLPLALSIRDSFHLIGSAPAKKKDMTDARPKTPAHMKHTTDHPCGTWS
jgi:hypothetical protein